MATRTVVKRTIRRKLDDIWGFTGDVNGTHSASAQVIYYKNAVNPEMMRAGFVLYNSTQDKHYIITGIDLTNALVSVQRNIDTQADGDDLVSYRYWYGAILDNAIDEALDWMWPALADRLMVSSIILSANTVQYAISAISGVKKV